LQDLHSKIRQGLPLAWLHKKLSVDGHHKSAPLVLK
jgi:hypothetical protein